LASGVGAGGFGYRTSAGAVVYRASPFRVRGGGAG